MLESADPPTTHSACANVESGLEQNLTFEGEADYDSDIDADTLEVPLPGSGSAAGMASCDSDGDASETDAPCGLGTNSHADIEQQDPCERVLDSASAADSSGAIAAFKERSRSSSEAEESAGGRSVGAAAPLRRLRTNSDSDLEDDSNVIPALVGTSSSSEDDKPRPSRKVAVASSARGPSAPFISDSEASEGDAAERDWATIKSNGSTPFTPGSNRAFDRDLGFEGEEDSGQPNNRRGAGSSGVASSVGPPPACSGSCALETALSAPLGGVPISRAVALGSPAGASPGGLALRPRAAESSSDDGVLSPSGELPLVDSSDPSGDEYIASLRRR